MSSLTSTQMVTERLFDLRKRCTDLWVAPDESIITFVAEERTRVLEPSESARGESPAIDQSSIYIARKYDDFAPALIVSRSFLIEGRSWSVVRNPRVSPDGRTLFFEIPYTMTTSRLMSVSLASGEYHTLGDATDYCVIWSGQYSGFSDVAAPVYTRRCQ